MKATFKYTRKEFAAIILFMKHFDLNNFPSDNQENLMSSIGAQIMERFMKLWEKRQHARNRFNITFSAVEMTYLIYLMEIAIEFEPQEPEPLLQLLIGAMEQAVKEKINEQIKFLS